MSDLWVCLRRLAHFLRVLLRHGIAHLLARALDRFPRALARLRPRLLAQRHGGDGPSRIAMSPPRRLRAIFEDLGGTFLKFGQMLALQPDIISLEYCNELLELLDRIEPFPFAHAEQVLLEELGRGPDEIFDSFEREPIATASVGQVYVAVLGGDKVAVKIQRPNIEVEFHNDIRLLKTFLRIIRWFRLAPLYWLIQPTSEFIAWSAEELDYRNEARYSEELRRHAQGNPVQEVPAIRSALTTRRTLVVDFLEGVTLLELLRARQQGNELLLRRLEAQGFDARRFSANVIENFLNDAFRHGIYHADLHPANLMILPDNVVGYIDFGITGLMSRYSRRHLVAMTLALARGDVETMKSEYRKITANDASSDVVGLSRGLDRLAAGWYTWDAGRPKLRVSITLIFDQILRLSRQTGFLPERDIVKYIRSAIAIDGLLTRFDPSCDLGDHIGRACARAMAMEARMGWMSTDRLQEWAGASSRLVADGPTRAMRWLDGWNEGLSASAHSGFAAASEDGLSGRRAIDWRRRSLYLAAAILGVSFALTSTAGPLVPGANLATAELLFLGAASLCLVQALRPAPGTPAPRGGENP